MNFEDEIGALRLDLQKLGEMMQMVAAQRETLDAEAAVDLFIAMGETLALQSVALQRLMAEVAAHRERIIEG